MAIAFDASAESNTGVVQVTSETFSHTCGTGSDRVLFVAIECQGGDYVSSVTYNSVSMTQGIKYQNSAKTSVWFYIYYLANPSTGSNDVVITNSTAQYIEATSFSYTGASQTDIVHATGSQSISASVSSITHSVTTTVDDCWAISFAGNNRATTASTNSTTRETSNFWNTAFCDTNGSLGTSGSKTMVQTFSSVNAMGGIILAFAPAVASSTSIKSIAGVPQADIKSIAGLILD